MSDVTPVLRRGTKVAEGKTKEIWGIEGCPNDVEVFSKDDITGGDGKRHDVVPGKGAVSNKTTCAVFQLLRDAGVSVAYKKRLGERGFLASRTAQVPLEIVVRRRATGSALERHPYLPKLHIFERLVFELFLKTTGKKWRETDIPVDDPFMQIVGDQVNLFDPHKPIHGQKPFLTIPFHQVPPEASPWRSHSNVLAEWEKLARLVFLILERAYILGGNFELIDMKIEVGYDSDGNLVVSDVIDAESVRLRRDGKHFDKQPYREEGLNPEVMQRFEEVLRATERFFVPRQQVILWAGSDRDDTKPFEAAVENLSLGTISVRKIVCSMHREVQRGLQLLKEVIQDIPCSVLCVEVSLSNGAGPALAAATTLPVDTIPMSAKEFPDDVWSSLRLPKNVPMGVVLSQENGAEHALRILAQQNPGLHARLRLPVEERLISTIPFSPLPL